MVHFNDEVFFYEFFWELYQLFEKEYKLKIPSLARNLGVSERGLYRTFEENALISPVKLINLMRIYAAKEQILFGISIDAILFNIKVDSLPYFHNMFKTYFKTTPSNFRNQKKYNIYSENELDISVYKNILRMEFKEFLKKHVNDTAKYLLQDELLNVWLKTFFSNISKFPQMEIMSSTQYRKKLTDDFMKRLIK